MASFDPYHRVDNSLGMRRWLFGALLASLFFHGALVAVFHTTKLRQFGEQTERLVPRTFTVGRAEIDPKLLESGEPDQTPAKSETPQAPRLDLPEEDPQFELLMGDIRATPTAPEEMAKPILGDEPRLDVPAMQAMQKMQQQAAAALEQDLSAVRDQLLKDTPAATGKSLLTFSDTGSPAGQTGTATVGKAVPGYSNLDALLGQSGGLKEGTPPILMPTDLLFDYDKSDIRPAAEESLRKLGRLIERNPVVTFSIEGHTDSFGSAEYNLVLSNRRAQSVKVWLVQNMGLDPAKIQTRGFGSSRLIAPATGTVEQQQINRRVEILVRTRS